MEQIKNDSISQGFIVYTNTDIKNNKQHSINITSIADNALILSNNEKIYQSNHTENSIQCNIPSSTETLSIIVENMGRNNYGSTLDLSRKGILNKVFI